MDFWINWTERFRSRPAPVTKEDLMSLLKVIIMKQNELAAQLNATAENVRKIETETRTLLTKVADLQAALENQDNVSPDLEAAAAALQAQVQVVDDLVPDAPAEPPVEPVQ